MSFPLSPAQVAQYRRDGFLFPVDVLPREEAANYRAEMESLEQRYGAGSLPQPLSRFFRVNGHVVIPFMSRIARTSKILDVVQSLLGPNLLVWSCELFIKEPGTRKIVSWHQDLTYWGLGETDEQMTAWVALSPATVESGCMRFVAGSHHQPLLPHRETFHKDNLLSRGQEIEVEVEESTASNIVLQPGQMSLHHGRMFHSSGPNLSQDRRIGVAIRYVTPGVRQTVAERDYAMLVRGCDPDRNWINFAPPEEPFGTDSMALYDRILADQSAVLG